MLSWTEKKWCWKCSVLPKPQAGHQLERAAELSSYNIFLKMYVWNKRWLLRSPIMCAKSDFSSKMGWKCVASKRAVTQAKASINSSKTALITFIVYLCGPTTSPQTGGYCCVHSVFQVKTMGQKSIVAGLSNSRANNLASYRPVCA